MPTTVLNLTADQQKALDAVNSGRNVFITGGAGTGKSYLLRAIVYSLMSVGKNVVVCAPTEIAAANVGGMTIHTTFNFNSNALISPKRKKPVQRVTTPVKGADVVIIDEISMCRLDVFEAVVASIMKAETVSGIHKQIIVMGDFYQLPPVIDGGQFDRQILIDYYGPTLGHGYAFQSSAWNECHFLPVVMNQIVRQSDPTFAYNLNLLRVGDTRCIPYFNAKSSPLEIPGAVGIYAFKCVNCSSPYEPDGNYTADGMCHECTAKDSWYCELCENRFAFEHLVDLNNGHFVCANCVTPYFLECDSDLSRQIEENPVFEPFE